VSGKFFKKNMNSKKCTTKDGREYIIREAQKSDAAALIVYMQQVTAESECLTLGSGEFDKTIEQEEEILEDYAKAQNKIFLVAQIDGEIISVSNIGASDKKRVRHCAGLGITVKKDFWGQGIGVHVMRELIDWSKNTGILRKINLKVLVHNERAIALYKKSGFEIEGTIRREMILNGEFVDAYMMGLLID